jgi:hypothetical protein
MSNKAKLSAAMLALRRRCVSAGVDGSVLTEKEGSLTAYKDGSGMWTIAAA